MTGWMIGWMTGRLLSNDWESFSVQIGFSVRGEDGFSTEESVASTDVSMSESFRQIAWAMPLKGGGLHRRKRCHESSRPAKAGLRANPWL